MIDDQVDRERGKARLTDGYDLKIWGMIKVEKIKRLQSLRIEAFFFGGAEGRNCKKNNDIR